MFSPTRVLTLFTSQHGNLSAGHRLGIVALAALMAATLAPLTLVGPAGAAAGDCTGEVFRDHNADGVRQVAGDPTGNGVDVYVTEPGEPGVIVTAYDDTGDAVGSTTTLADGTFDLSTSAGIGTPIRVEFTWTEAWMTSGPHGPDNGSSVQFSTTGSCNLTFGVMNAAEYCQANPYLTIPCYRQGDYDAPGNVGTNDALVTIGYEWGQDTPNPAANQTNWKPTWQVDEAGALAPPLMTADSLDVGTVWGETWSATDEVLFAAAYMKVAADFGPGGPGAIYAVPMDPDNGVPSGPVTQFADLDALGFDVCSDPHGPDLTDPAITVPTVTDATYGAVGKCGLGGLAIDDTDETLYTVNLTSRELVALDVATGAAVGSWGFLDTAAGLATPRCADPATDFRPFALEWHDGELYAGAICSAESTGVDSNLQAYVYQVDLAAGTFELILDYQLQSESILWRAWETTLADTSTEASLTAPSWLNGNGWVVHPTPLLTDIGFYNRDLVLGFRDMMADKTGQMIAIPEFSAVQPAGLWVAPSTGDLACAAFTPNPGDPTTGSWNIEEGNQCGDRTGANVEGASFKEIGTNDRVGLEFYQDGGGQNIGTVDTEIHLGAVASVPGLPLVQTTVNPSEHIGQVPRIVWSSGLAWNDSTQGSSLRGYLVYTGSGPTDISNFGKTSGLGDVEPLCGLAPLEIGNFVWYDADGDGIQSPSEAPVQGATVNLYDGAGNLLDSTTTGPDGEYYFNVDPTTGYVIRMDHADDFAAGGPLDRWILTVDSADADDDADSDGVPGADGFPEIAYSSGRAGANDHTLDFGYFQEDQIFDLALIKQLSDGTNLATVAPGDQVTFTITVTNQGALDATQIAVIDYLPNGLTLADPNWTDLGNGTAQLATPIAFLAAGDTTTIDITVTVDPDATGQLDNWAEISAHLDADGNPIDDIDSTPNTDQTDDNQPDGPGAIGDDEVGEDGKQGGDEDDHDVAGVTINPIFDLALIKQLSDGTNLATVAPGDPVTFTITVTNQGALDATQIAVIDYLPTGLTLADPNWTDLGNGTAQLTTPIPFLAAGDTTTIDITVTVDPDATGQLDNWAEISAHLDADGNPIDDIDSTPNTDQTDDNQPDGPGAIGDDEVGEDGKQGGDEDDHDVAGVTINPIFDLALIKQLSDGTNLATVAPGDQVTFTITVTNQGALDATQIAVIDYLPNGLTLADPNWTDLGNGTAQLATPIAFLAAGDTTTIDITVTVDPDATGQLDNWAEISAHLDADGNPIDDIDSTPNTDQTDDNQPDGPGAIGDDEVGEDGKQGGDEDDHDVAGVTINPIFDLALIKQLSDGTNLATVAPGDPSHLHDHRHQPRRPRRHPNRRHRLPPHRPHPRRPKLDRPRQRHRPTRHPHPVPRRRRHHHHRHHRHRRHRRHRPTRQLGRNLRPPRRRRQPHRRHRLHPQHRPNRRQPTHRTRSPRRRRSRRRRQTRRRRRRPRRRRSHHRTHLRPGPHQTTLRRHQPDHRHTRRYRHLHPHHHQPRRPRRHPNRRHRLPPHRPHPRRPQLDRPRQRHRPTHHPHPLPRRRRHHHHRHHRHRRHRRHRPTRQLGRNLRPPRRRRQPHRRHRLNTQHRPNRRQPTHRTRRPRRRRSRPRRQTRRRRRRPRRRRSHHRTHLRPRPHQTTLRRHQPDHRHTRRYRHLHPHHHQPRRPRRHPNRRHRLPPHRPHPRRPQLDRPRQRHRPTHHPHPLPRRRRHHHHRHHRHRRHRRHRPTRQLGRNLRPPRRRRQPHRRHRLNAQHLQRGHVHRGRQRHRERPHWRR